MQDEKAWLIKRKIERLVRENYKEALDFMLIVLSNDGYLPTYSNKVSFERFIQRYSSEKYESVKKQLMEDEVLIRETKEVLELSHYRKHELAQECAKLIYQLKQKD